MSTKFYCKLWKITRKSQQSILNIVNKNPVYIPEFPELPTGNFYVFGTALSRSENGTFYYNDTGSCGETIYWRSLFSVNTQTIYTAQEIKPRGSTTETRNYWYLDDNRTRITAITQTDYNNEIDTSLPVDDLYQLKELVGNTCEDVSDNDRIYADTVIATNILYETQSDRDKVANFNNAFSLLEITNFNLGQEITNYGIRVTWKQSKEGTNYTLGNIYQSDTIGSFLGNITQLYVYIKNNRYSLEVHYNNGTQIATDVYLTSNGNFIEAVNGSDAEAGYGIYNIECVRLDGNPDNGGNRPQQQEVFTEIIEPVCLTNFDTPIEYDGNTYLPYYGGSSFDISRSISGENFSSELEFAISTDAISENNLLSGIYHDAEIVCYTYDWGNNELYYQNWVGYLNKVTIEDSLSGAFSFKIEVNSVLSKLKRKDYHLISAACTHIFGDAKCGVNLLANGLVDDITILAITDGITLITDSPRTDPVLDVDYYERIEYIIDDIIYSYEVASYDPSTQIIKTWTSVLPSNIFNGANIKAIRRCDRTRSDCLKFHGNNIYDYGGFDQIPAEHTLNKVKRD